MKTRATLFSLTTVLATSSLFAQFDVSQIQYWIGTGADTSVLVVDFQDATAVSSYAWGYLHNGGTAAEMLDAIAAADANFSIDVTGGFLNSVTYLEHAGIGGEPDYWSTWSGTGMADLASNMGISAELGNGDWFGCSYTDFNPALPPGEPVPAMVPTGIAETLRGTGLQVYPQPATELLHVSTAFPAGLPIVIHNTSGVRVHEARSTEGITTINVGNWPAGAYLLNAGGMKRTIIIQ